MLHLDLSPLAQRHLVLEFGEACWSLAVEWTCRLKLKDQVQLNADCIKLENEDEPSCRARSNKKVWRAVAVRGITGKNEVEAPGNSSFITSCITVIKRGEFPHHVGIRII